MSVYLNKNAAAGINPGTINHQQLAIRMLNSIEQQPDLLPGLARLTLYGSQLYGERRGETLSPLQQNGLVGQTLCQLIYHEDNIALRVAKIFVGNRHITQQAFAALVQSWPYSSAYERDKWLWQERYEAPEIPVLYLKSLYKIQDGPASITQNQTVAFDLDNLWIGSLTWTLMHFGARSITLDDAGKLEFTSLQALMELGIGLVGMFRQGLLSTGVEPTMYLGLLLYYLRVRPELSLEEVLASDTLEPAFDLFKAELERRHLVAQGLYDGFIYYQVNYQRPVWRSRKAAAEELLKQHCGSAQAPIMSLNNIKLRALSQELNPVRQLLMQPDGGQQCVASGVHIPALDGFYRQEVDRFAGKILALDSALLSVVFMPSDMLDDDLQPEDEQFLQRAAIEWVIPRLSQRRTIHDMFYSNMPVHYLAKPDTSFFQAASAGERRLFALQITGQGYLLRKILLEDKYLNALRPFMADWPISALTPQHEFTLLPSGNTVINKQTNETLSLFLERYTDFHYQSYRQKIYELGYEEMEPSLGDILHKAAGYIIPFYGCASALKAGRHTPAFTECLVDGALVGIPLVFTGIKAGSGLFRAASIGAGRTLSGPRFSASGEEIFRNVVPATVQIAGGIAATQSQLRLFMDVMGKEAFKSLDPGFAALRSLSILTKGLYLALLGRTTLRLIAWQRNLAKVSSDIPKYVMASHVLNYQISYDADGYMPLTVKVKGVAYPVFNLQNSSIVAVETGERSLDGQLVFAQLDLQYQYGIYKKYYCLSIGDARCQLSSYTYPDFKIEMDATFPRPADSHYFWVFKTSSPIFLTVVHPLHLLDFADRRWVVFEINGRRWAFSRESATLMPADNIEDWQLSPGHAVGLSSMIESGENDRSFRLRLTPLHHRRKRETVLPRVLDWGRQLANYTLDDEDVSGFPAVIHDDSTLNVQIGEARYLLSPETNAGTFLLSHPRQSAAPAFRVAYRVGLGDFVFASPLEPSNAHHIGELLRQRIIDNPQATQEPHIDILLPPLVNGAFSYGNKMFLKIGERFLHIALFDGVYHTLSMDGGDKNGKSWTLRYELFTGGFDIVDARLTVMSTSTYAGIAGALSRFEKLAARTFSKSAYPSLAALCRPENPALDISSASPSLRARLRQVALLLRLDPSRRAELLHASSVALRTFKMNSTLPEDWLANFRPLALWSTLVKMVAACLVHQNKEGLWTSRTLAWIKNSSWPFPPPVVIVQGPDLRIFILNKELAASQGMHTEKEYEVQLFPDGVEAVPLVSEDGFRRWLPSYEEIQPTVVTKFLLSETQQPMFWVDASNQTWAQTPDGVKTRLYRQNSHHPVHDIIVSPDGGTVVMLVERTSLRQRALFYHLAYMGSPAVREEISHYGEAILTGPFIPGRAWWVNNRGDLFAPWEKHWSFMDEDHPHWDTPEGYQPNFVSPDQRFLGYVKRDDNMVDQDILLIDITSDKQVLLHRSHPVVNKGYGLGKMVSIAFSALNALVAVGFADGYIEIYRIRKEEHADKAFSLGHAYLPHGKYVLSGVDYLKPKQMVMKFNNAFDQLLVFHDIGEFRADLKGNGTYAISEIYLADGK
ncbi:hypothetical protein [Sodalis sp. dw_96]|uniref:hypothetical protein n=1 Tax=Sodalis sp. dw_96 TaxID=2719794 RepID=UPI001BD5AFB1|nr:hypothetical protein [Sodalis sp. dw_96]